jgi:5'-nucleotidase
MAALNPSFRSLLLAIGMLFAFNSCNTAPRIPGSADVIVHEPSHGLETIAILGTNDLHGTLAPLEVKTREKPGVETTPYHAGGAAMIASYIKKLRSEFGSRLIWLDAGDEFQGSVESNSNLGAPMVSLFNSLQLTAAAVGNHEFDFGVPTLKKRMTEAKYPYLAANIQDKASGEPADFPNTLPRFMVTAGKLKVGIIGLSTIDTPKTTRATFVAPYAFENLKTATLREAEILRQEGAKVVVIVTHSGLKCETGHVSSSHIIRKPTDVQGECADTDEVVRLLRSLPAGTVDAVVSGHTHTVVHHWVANVPVIQGGALGRYLNVIYLTYDWEKKSLVSDEAKIEGPIPVCEKVFKNQNDCNGDRSAPRAGRGTLQAPKFHGSVLTPDAHTAQLIQPILAQAEITKAKKLAVVSKPVEHSLTGESEFGNLAADAIRNATRSDMSLINTGYIRSSLENGPLTYGSLYRSLPFDNAVAQMNINSKELGLILRVAESGARGFPSVSGITVNLIHPSLAAPFDDLTGDGRFDLWEVNRILDVRLENGKRLDPSRLYSLATLDFVAMGGDDLSWSMQQIPKQRINFDTGILARDAIADYIQKKGTLNTPEAPLVVQEQPRLSFKFVKSVKKAVQKLRNWKRKKRNI